MMLPAIVVMYALLFYVSHANPPWELVFADEFDGSSPTVNPMLWEYEVGYIRNHELQWYDNSTTNVNVTNGTLRITATNRPLPLPDGHVPFCRSGSIFTRASFTYGRFEIRAKLPGRPGNGTWPAFWLLGANFDAVGWPMCGEIDIMENVGFDRNSLFTTIHDAQNSSMRNNEITRHVPVLTMYTAFNTYWVEWTPNHIAFFVNNQSILKYANDERCRDTSWPFHRPFQIKLNLAIGGAWGGMHGVDESVFPASYDIDYVRVFQRKNDRPPACLLRFGYVILNTSVEADQLRWAVGADGLVLSSLYHAVETDIAELAGVPEHRVHVWSTAIWEPFPGFGSLLVNFSVVDWEAARAAVFFDLAGMIETKWPKATQILDQALGTVSGVGVSSAYASQLPPQNHSIPFRNRFFDEVILIPAWEYDFGGADVAYRDTTPWNLLGQHGRAAPDTVDVGPGSGGNLALGYIEKSEWITYSGLNFIGNTTKELADLSVSVQYSSVWDSESNCTLSILNAQRNIQATLAVRFLPTQSWSKFAMTDTIKFAIPTQLLKNFAMRLNFDDHSPFNIQMLHVMITP